MTKDKTTLEEAKSYVDNMYQEKMEQSNEVKFTDLELASIRLLRETTLLGYKLKDKENIIKEVRDKLNTQLAFTSSYQLNYQSAMSIIEEAKSILDKENK